MTLSPTASAARYVYGIVRAEAADAIDVRGVGDPPEPLEALAHGRVAALVSPVAAEGREATREDILAHARALEAIGERTDVLPMRFGMTLPAPDAVVDELLAPHHDRWEQLLDEFQGTVELRVKAFHDQDAVLRRIVEEDAEIRALRGRDSMADKIRLGELVAGAVERQRQADADRLLDRLRPHARAVRELELSAEGMVLDAAFLVDRDAAIAFDREVAKSAEEVAERMRMRCLGPQPPYTFVTEATGS